MSHKQPCSQYRAGPKTPSYRKQGGALLPVAIFIIVVMSILGVTMNRLLIEAARSTVSDIYGARADAAARSGAEVLLTEIFPLRRPDEETFPNHEATCSPRLETPDVDKILTLSFQEQGLSGCDAVVSCDYLELPEPFTGVNIRVNSTSSCNVGNNTYSKEIVLEASHGIE